jgi:hypothetical protein
MPTSVGTNCKNIRNLCVGMSQTVNCTTQDVCIISLILTIPISEALAKTGDILNGFPHSYHPENTNFILLTFRNHCIMMNFIACILH